ncbi:MAG TPA: hypothetical protein VKR38_11430 [Usitatibacter sp.]|nr:hypothetical protein [Usitatibacter sp.]
MKRATVVAALAICFAIPAVHAADAAATAVPPPKCDPKPEYPGKLALQSDNRAKSFRKELDTYKDCVNAYLADRTAAVKANEAAANTIINDYNAVMKKINDAQTAAKDE